MRPGPALDQYGNRWLVEERSGSMWAIGSDDDGAPVIRYICQFGEGATDFGLNWHKPRGWRELRPDPCDRRRSA